MTPPRVAVYPGSFDPLTVAHLAIADAARTQLDLDRLDLAISRIALVKEDGAHSSVEARVTAIERVAAGGRPWLAPVVTDDRLIADIADGYDACVMGADKWHQIHDLTFYDGDDCLRDALIGRLPLLAVAPRAGIPTPTGDGVVLLDIDPAHADVSSSAVRGGRHDWRA